MSLVELFCHVDDFCQAFEPFVDTRSIHDRAAAAAAYRSTVFERDHDLVDLVSHVSVPHVQGLLPAACVSASPRCVSGVSQLWAFCRVNAFGTYSVEHLSASMPRPLHGNFV